MKKPVVFMNVAYTSDCFVVCFKNQKLTQIHEMSSGVDLDLTAIRQVLNNNLTIGFESLAYDLILLDYLLNDRYIYSKTTTKNQELYGLSLRLGRVRRSTPYDHVDLSKMFRGDNSLELYGARMHMDTLPIAHKILPSDAHPYVKSVKAFVESNVNVIAKLYLEAVRGIEMRKCLSEQFGQDMTNCSMPEIVEACFESRLDGLRPKIDYLKFFYRSPSFLRFKTKPLIDLLGKIEHTQYELDSINRIYKIKDHKYKATVNGNVYQLGLGGIHSKEKCRAIKVDDTEFLVNVDATSYYPSLILNDKLLPSVFFDKFLDIYQDFFDNRMNALATNDIGEADRYKALINNTFGKFGDQHSVLYDPQRFINTTLTGQLAMLMLIEDLTIHGFEVVSANTDGLMVVGINEDERVVEIRRILASWEDRVNCRLVVTSYDALYTENVNSYIALSGDHSAQLKGSFAEESINRNPVSNVCKKAALYYLRNQTPVIDTIMDKNNSPSDYINVQKVSGGAVFGDQVLGDVIRYYYSKNNNDCIRYKSNNRKVPYTDSATPVLDLSKGLARIDYKKYVTHTYGLLFKLGVDIEVI